MKKLLEAAWGLIANANEGDWDKATLEWKEAEEKWRDEYFKEITMSKETMEERFDKEFKEGDRNSVHCKAHDVYATPGEIIRFINLELQRERNEIVEMLDEVVDKHTTGVDDGTEARKVLKGCPDELRADIIKAIKER